MVDQELKTIRNFITAANILVVVSIFLIGAPLSLAAIICAFIAWRKLKTLAQSGQIDEKTLLAFQRKASTALILSIGIFALNAVTAYIMYPYTMEMVNQIMGQSGSMSSGAAAGASSAASGSIWG